MKTERIETVIIGGGQAGLAAGYYLSKAKRDFVILDAQARTGESWRKRWDALQLFTSTSFNNLPGMPFPGSASHCPTKDEMADYLEGYAAHFRLPIHLNSRVKELTRDGDTYLISTNELILKAAQVIVATGAYSNSYVPSFARNLDPTINQFHSIDYRNKGQLRDGAVLVVGAGNSGVEIALDLASKHPVWLSGRDTGIIPLSSGDFRYELGVLLFKKIMQLLTVDTLPGRWVVQKAREFTGGHPVVGVTPEDLVRTGVRRVSRVTGVSGGKPLLEDGRTLDVVNIIWSTGFVRDYRWIKLPVFDDKGEPIHHRGVVQEEPGLYFMGLPYQSSVLSSLVAGAGADAKYIAKQIVLRSKRSNVTREENSRFRDQLGNSAG